MPKTEPPKDPNAPLIAYQRHLDEDSQFFEGRGAEFHQPLDVPSNHRLGHLPGLDAQEGSPDE